MANPAAFSLRSLLLASLLLLLCMSPLTPSLAQQQQPSPQPQPTPPPSFAFGWLGDKAPATFQAGETATIMIKALDLAPPPGAIRPSSFYFSLSVDGKKGNGTVVTDVAAHVDGGDPSSWNITFVPLRAGDFVALVAEERFAVGGESSLQFTVAAAGVHPATSAVSWISGGEQVAGARSHLAVVARDAFGNAIPRGSDVPLDGFFAVSGSYVNGSSVELIDFHYNGWTDDGRLSFDFGGYTLAGDILVHVRGNNTEFRGSPLRLTVKPGQMDVSKCDCYWKHGTNHFQVFSKVEIFLYQRDTFGNIFPEIHPFDARVDRVGENATKYYYPVTDLSMEAVADGVQLLTFDVPTGEYELTVFDAKSNQTVANKAYKFDVFLGYCNGSNSFANGSGLAHSVAGSTSSFTVFLEDEYGIPSPVETAIVQVNILSKSATASVYPVVSLIRDPNGMISAEGPSSFNLGPAGQQEIIAENATVQASQFNVSYTPQIAGEYEILVLCGNILLNGGNPYAMTVLPGAINASLSNVLIFDPRVKRSVQNQVIVRLADSFMNPVVSLESKLKFQLTSATAGDSTNKKNFVPGEFVDNRDGSYTARYVANYLGSFGVCVQFEDKQLAPCPFEVHVLEDKYFPDAKNVSVSVWEDESVSFDVLSNNYIAGRKVNSSSPLHGSVLQFSQIFRYTPFEGFFGNDSFSYTVSDENNSVLTGTVFISVRCRPPQFISLPQKLHVTEDILGPKFDGFPGIKLVYSDITENISVTVKAQSGNVFLAPMPEKLQQPSDYELSTSRGSNNDLILEGTVEAVNDALQYLQYIGNEDFYGNDVILLYAANRNGIEDAKFPIIVEPINDPPMILAPKSIFLGGNESIKGYKIFDNNVDNFKFSIVEPDLRNYPGNKSDFLLELSLEVFEGTLTTTLPAGIISNVELKTEGINSWLPFQELTIDLSGSGIRFLGNVQECNNVMQNLFYSGSSHDTSLTITVNDLGNYGCYPDCSGMMSASLFAVSTIHLVKTKHINLGTPLWLRTVVAIQIPIMLCLCGGLMYYVLKCMKALKDERKEGMDDTRRPEQTPLRQRTCSSDAQSEIAECRSAPAAVLPLRANTLSFRQRSLRSGKQELELQPVSVTRNSENHDGHLITEKDK